jgi:hypothetical protein
LTISNSLGYVNVYDILAISENLTVKNPFGYASVYDILTIIENFQEIEFLYVSVYDTETTSEKVKCESFRFSPSSSTPVGTASFEKNIGKTVNSSLVGLVNWDS